MTRTRYLVQACVAAAVTVAATAATLDTAKVTVTVNKVSVEAPDEAVRVAAIGDLLSGKASLETGDKSRAELVFNDQSIARLGANSVFSFLQGTRELELNQGVILMQVPKHSGGATIQTASVTAAITGTTIAVEYFRKHGIFPGSIKVLVLEGTLRLFLKSNPGESMLLSAGQMVFLRPDAKKLPDPMVYDIARLTSTSGLLSKQFSTIPSLPLIEANIQTQKREEASGHLILSNYSLHGQIPSGVAFFTQTSRNQALSSVARTQAPPPPRPVIVQPPAFMPTPVPFVPPPPTPPPTPQPPPPPTPPQIQPPPPTPPPGPTPAP